MTLALANAVMAINFQNRRQLGSHPETALFGSFVAANLQPL